MPATGGSRSEEPKGSRRRDQGLGEVKDWPASAGGDPAEAFVRVDSRRMPDRFEKRDVGMGIAVRGRPSQVDRVASRDLTHSICLQRSVARSERPAGENAVLDLACRADRTV